MLIVSLTTWYKRILNLPIVLDSILSNTILPDKIVVNLSEEDFPNRELPKEVAQYIASRSIIELNWHKENMKVYKKFLPTFKLCPDAWILTADDDYKYPTDWIETFLQIHEKYPTLPISGNHYSHEGIKYHCGACSLVCAKHFEGWEKYYNKEFVEECPASDIFYTWLALSNGYLYERIPSVDYGDPKYQFDNTEAYSPGDGSKQRKSLQYLEKVFGYTVHKWFKSEVKPLCVFSVMNVPRGLRLMREMLEWLQPWYNVLCVIHDGSKFEYPGLNLLQKIVVSMDYHGPVMYIHTKGAWFVRKTSECVRNVWKYEFSTPERRQLYLDAVSCKEPLIAAPYGGLVCAPKPGFEEGPFPMYVPWFNGWIANDSAVRKMNIFESENRFDYEGGIYKGIRVIGIREQNIDTTIDEARNRMYSDVLKF